MQKPIIINEANRSRLEDMLDKAQAHASVRLFKIDYIYTIPEKIAKYKENKGIHFADLEGCKFFFDTYETMPNCYKYRVSYTAIEVIYEKGKCRVISIYRAEDNNKRAAAHYNRAVLTDTAKQAIIDNASYLSFY